MRRISFTAFNTTFEVNAEYEFVKQLGQGAYGCVIGARHISSGQGCAIKKITNINTKVCFHCLYSSPELTIIRPAGHTNKTLPEGNQVGASPADFVLH